MLKRDVAILLYDGVEVLDFAGPFEVFSVTSELNDYLPFNVYTVATETGPVRSVNGLQVVPDRALAESPPPDVAVVPGGSGSVRAMADGEIVDWVRRAGEASEVLLSICSGARILAKAGLLRGRRVTTHHEVIEDLRTLAPDADVVTGPRFIDTGQIITTGGISAGIDGSFHVVARLLGDETALGTARYMEYAFHRITPGSV